MKEKDPEIRRAILRTQADNYGVVALKYSDECRHLEIEILDEPFEDNVRVYPA